MKKVNLENFKMSNSNEAPVANNAKGAFKPIFTATITPAEIETRVTASGDNAGSEYGVLAGATVQTKSKTEQRMVMAFGKSFEDTKGMLVPGQAVELACQYDGGVVRIVGPVREKPVAAAA